MPQRTKNVIQFVRKYKDLCGIKISTLMFLIYGHIGERVKVPKTSNDDLKFGN